MSYLVDLVGFNENLEGYPQADPGWKNLQYSVPTF